MSKVKWKTFMAALSVLCMMALSLPFTAQAKDVRISCTAKTSGKGNAIQLRNVYYDGIDKYGTAELEVNFLHRVTWKRTARVVSVKDEKGITYEGYLRDKDGDDCEIAIDGLKEGRTYTIVMDGIKKRGTTGYRKLTLKAKIPASKKAGKVKVKKVEVDDDNDDYDKYQTEIEIKFASKVSWKRNAKVTSVKDSQGKSYQGYLTNRENDECEVYIKNMKYGRTYTIKISGVKARGAVSYETVTVKVKIPARTHALRVKDVEYEEETKYDDYDVEGLSPFTVDFEFNRDVFFKGSSYVIVKDASGRKYASRDSYVEWDDDECTVHLTKRLKYGKTYRDEIVNVKATGEKSYSTLRGSFVAR